MSDDEFEKAVKDLMTLYPMSKNRFDFLLSEYHRVYRKWHEAIQMSERFKYRLNKAEEELKKKIPDKSAVLIIKNGIVEDVRVSPEKEEMAQIVMGKHHESAEVEYFISQLQMQGFVVNLEVKK